MGIEELQENAGVTKAQPPALPPVPGTFVKGEKAGKERAEAKGQRLMVPLGFPFP